MEGGDPWSFRLSSSSSSSRRYQFRSEAFLGGDDIVDVEEDYKQEFSCPFCVEEFDIVGLFCHIDEEHQVEVKHGVCPICAKRVGMDLVSHITMQHGNILKVQRKRRLRRGIPNSMFNILRKELREGNRQSLFGGSSFVLSSSNPDPDPLLSSFIYNSNSGEELGKEEPHSSKKATPIAQAMEKSKIERTNPAMEKSKVESAEPPLLSKKDHEEKSRKCEFVQGLLLSTILDE